MRGIPTMILFKNGEVSATPVGALPKSQIKEWLQRGLSRPEGAGTGTA